MKLTPQQIESRLAEVIGGYGRLLTAYSGGVDSTVVAVVARRVLGRARGIAVIGDSASLPRAELDAARELARAWDIELIEAAPGEQEDAQYRANAADRCYHCKTHLYATLSEIAKKYEVERIANGANLDDRGDYRPGMKAAHEASVVSPLIEAGMDKAMVRSVARALGLKNSEKPAAACLASRIPYGMEVTMERLSQVERAEKVLADMGFVGFRVRHHERVARLEIPSDQAARVFEAGVREDLIKGIKGVGYTYVTLDLEGFRSGSGNDVLSD